MIGLILLVTFVGLCMMILNKNNWLAQEMDMYTVMCKFPFLHKNLCYDTYKTFKPLM